MNSQKTWLLLVCLVSAISSLDSAKILGIFYLNSKSHYSIIPPFMNGLAKRGHHVTVLSHFKSTMIRPNYTEMLIDEGILPYVDNVNVNDREQFKGPVSITNSIRQVEEESCDRILRSEFIQKIVKSKTKSFDLLIAEEWYSQCFNLLGHLLDIPLIVLVAGNSATTIDIMIGNFINPSVVPVDMTPYTSIMNFYDRFTNAIRYIFVHVQYYTMNGYMRRISNELFNVELPPVDVLHRRVAAVFYNSHFSIKNRPNVPNAVDIAGIHIGEAKPLPQDLQEFIDGAEEGVIFFSFGSVIKMSSIDPQKLRAINEAFSSIPQRIIWRTNELNVTDLVANVKVGNWFPQRDILEHKNVRAFISHCGLFSTLEAIHTATPVIGIPIIADQFQNANILVEDNVGVLVEYDDIDKNVLVGAINEVLYNKKYRDNMEKLSKIFKDRPTSALNTAIYWTEYVLRYDGAPHLRVAAADMPFYQYLLLDIIGFILVSVASTLHLLKYFLINIISLFSKDKKKYKKK